MVASSKAKKKPAAPRKKRATEPILTCPFTGEPFEIVYSENIGTYMATGKFWNSKLYKSKQELLHDFSHRDGVAPTFSREPPVITARDIERPEVNPNEDMKVVDVMAESEQD
jgi:hypothetical protein